MPLSIPLGGRMIRIFVLLALVPALGGCAAVVAGGIFYDHAKSREDRAAFTADFRKQNFEREKAGLQPLDWCTELYRTKPSWAAEDTTCIKQDQTKTQDQPAIEQQPKS
jgi:hypothetical protein